MREYFFYLFLLLILYEYGKIYKKREHNTSTLRYL